MYLIVVCFYALQVEVLGVWFKLSVVARWLFMGSM